MTRSRIGYGVAASGLVMLAASTASAAISLADIATATGASLNPGLSPGGVVFGTVITADGHGFQTTPFAAPLYDFTVGSPMGIAAGDVRDFHWAHETSGAFAAPALGTKWVFGSPNTDFILDPLIDHTPVFEEAFETTLYGSIDGGATWTLGTMVEIFALGWHPGSADDDGSSRWTFPFPVNMISATAGFSQGSFSFTSFDTEIDAVSMVIPLPTPLGMGLAGMGLLAFGVRRRPR